MGLRGRMFCGPDAGKDDDVLILLSFFAFLFLF